MRTLPELQREFASALLAADASASWGMARYRSNAFGNWTGALAGAYPIVRKIVGAEFFDALARRYAREYGSTSGDLHEFGSHLASFVAGFADTQDLPYLPDVARMEWLAHRSYYAADCRPLDVSALASLDAAASLALRLELAPGTALLQSDWPLVRLWEVHQDEYQGELAIAFDPGPHRIAIVRPRWRVAVHALAPGDHRFLQGAQRGELLGELLAAATALDPRFDPSTALARWLHLRAIGLS